MKLLKNVRALLARFKTEIEIYRLVLRHPLTPRSSRIILGIAIAYAVSPIDLIPDFIPVIGHLDDALILPILIWAATRNIPASVIQECRSQVERAGNGQPDVVADGHACTETFGQANMPICNSGHRPSA
jgi:uncharacterized membrane protein YkvA (DUF1232 family)